jgi:flagellar biosynthesis/type III secretory pathway protein FliH
VGRVVKNAPSSDEAYVVVPPPVAVLNGKHDDELLFPEAAEAEVEAEPETVAIPVEAEPIDWPALHEQAGALLDAAAADAEAILTEARGRMRTIVETAQAGAEEIAERARAEGREAGHREGVAEAEREMEEMLATMRGLIDMARVERHKIIEGAEPEIVRLAMGIAERILHKAVEVDRDVVVAIAKDAIAQLVDRESITVRVNPIDLERMKQHRDDMLALGETKHMRVIEDQRVDPGGVVVETEAGAVDAKISTQVEEARRVLRLDGDRQPAEAPAETPTGTAD